MCTKAKATWDETSRAGACRRGRINRSRFEGGPVRYHRFDSPINPRGGPQSYSLAIYSKPRGLELFGLIWVVLRLCLGLGSGSGVGVRESACVRGKSRGCALLRACHRLYAAVAVLLISFADCCSATAVRARVRAAPRAARLDCRSRASSNLVCHMEMDGGWSLG